MRTVRAKKQLGQHFLRDQAAACRIAATVQGCQLPVLEVGPGMGVLTQHLLQEHEDFLAVEKDQEAVRYLLERYPALSSKLIEGDFLRLPLEPLFGGEPFALIGNYPYNISTQIFFRLLEDPDRIPLCSGMLQREVAQRICASPGSKDYGILSVLLQLWYHTSYLFTVPPEAFSPPPKVHGGVLLLRRNTRRQLSCDARLLKLTVKTAFNRRRKTLHNALKPLSSQSPQPFSHPLLSQRAEQLSVEDFIELTQALASHLSYKNKETDGLQ